MIGQAVAALAKLAPDAFDVIRALDFTAIHALAEWLLGNDDEPEPTGVLNRLPDVLRSELALARMEARAAKKTEP